MKNNLFIELKLKTKQKTEEKKNKFYQTNSIYSFRIAQDDYKTYLKGVQDNSELVTGTLEEMASELQRKFESLVADDNEIYEKACKGAYYPFMYCN